MNILSLGGQVRTDMRNKPPRAFEAPSSRPIGMHRGLVYFHLSISKNKEHHVKVERYGSSAA